MEKFGNIEIEFSNSMEQAKSMAFDWAGNTLGQVIPVIIFTQGGRLCASASIPMGLAVKVLAADPVNNQSTLEQVQHSYNRPINKDHVKSVSDYLVNACENSEKFILPSLTVTAVKKHKIFTIEFFEKSSFTQLGYLILSLEDPSLTVTDGQHRLEGIKSALSRLEGGALEKLKKDSIAIMFSFEDELAQIHQDFADCSKTKALPKSMIAVYDRRIPINGLTLDVIDKCVLFSDGRTDSTSVSLGKKSNHFALTSSVRSIMKTLFTGNYSMADNALDDYANKNLADKEAYKYHAKLIIQVVDLMTKYSPILNEISQLERGPQRQKISQYREKYLIANPTGLALACKVVHMYMLHYRNEPLEPLIQKLMLNIDWLKSATIWRGNIINERNGSLAMSSTNKVFNLAVESIARSLEIDLDDQPNLEF